MRGVLFWGPPGSGRTMRARALAQSIPVLTGQDAVETAWIRQGAGLLREVPEFAVEPPLRAPHHTVSEAGLVGTVAKGRVRPGEASLAHNGILLLDELPEFRRSSIRSLADVLRAGRAGILPARPKIVCATAGLCACQMTGSSRPCTCTVDAMVAYIDRIMEYGEMLGITEVVPCHGLESPIVPQISKENVRFGVR